MKQTKAKAKATKATCTHGYKITNPVTCASSMCWNVECRSNG